MMSDDVRIVANAVDCILIYRVVPPPFPLLPSDISTTLLKEKLKEVSRNVICARTKALIDTAIGLDTGTTESILDMSKLEYRDTSTRNISRVLGRGGFKLVLEDDGKALAVL